MRSPALLKSNPRNARTHSKRQIRQIADSIKAYGFNNPILVDENDTILAGHGRIEAAKLAGMERVPTLVISQLSDAQKRAYVLADNRLADLAGWDRSMLAAELGELSILLPTLNVDWSIETTGFSSGEIEVLSHDHAETPDASEDALPSADVGEPAVTRLGDVWQLGSHRLLCGNACSTTVLSGLMGEERAAMVFADPPYNVPVAGHVTRAKKHREFPMATGEMSRAEFRTFLQEAFGNAAAFSRPGSVHALCMDWRHIADLIGVGEQVYEALLNIAVWNKGVAGQGSFYRSQHELVAIFRVRGAPHRNNIELGRRGRNRSNVWTYAIAASGDDREGAAHPTPKPVALVADALRDCTLRGEVVLDPFLGSGTTLIAAEKVGRVCFSIELDARYVDLTVRRWQAYAGQEAVLLETSETLAEVEKRQRGEGTSAPPDAA